MYKPTILAMMFCVTVVQSIAPRTARCETPRVQFDLPGVAVAYHQLELCEEPAVPVPIPTGWQTVTFELRLSCITSSLSQSPAMQQCIVRCRPRDSSLQIVDYWPRTEVTSELTTPIQIKRTDEKTRSTGFSLDASYGKLVQGNVGSDRGNKSSESVQFDRAAPVQAVIAAGTMDRGRGAYFKMRWTDTQVLEGERRFRLTMNVPPGWRGELVDVSVVGEAEHTSLAGWERETRQVASANFIVATYLEGDIEAAQLAYQLADAEYRLRSLAMRLPKQRSPKTFPEMLRHVAMKIDVDSRPPDTIWLVRLLQGQADPHVDSSILELPVDIRVAALDYVEHRSQFRRLRAIVGADDSPEIVSKVNSTP